jgi:hypothetical protein
VAVFWRLGGVAARVSDNYLTKHRGLLAWIRRAVRNVELSADPGSEFRPLPRGRDGLVRRLWIERQQAYFAERGPANGRRAAWLDRFAHWSLVCSITVGVLYALCLVSGCLASGAADVAEVLCLSQSDPHNLFQAGIGLSLAMGAALQAWSAKRAYGELARHYRLAGDLFALAASELDAGAPPTRVFLALGRWALAENGEWLWTHRNLDDEAPR